MASLSYPGHLLDGPDVWTGPALAATPARWLHPLTAAELDELDATAARVDDAIARHGPAALAGLTAAEVPLPTLGPRLAAIRAEVLTGCGVALLRGLRAEHPLAHVAARFWILGLHLGRPVPQNRRGHLLGHVCDVGADPTAPTTRLYQTSQRQGYHTDSADLVALACLRPALRGGLSTVASTAAAYNRVFAEDPDLARALFEPVATDHRGEQPPGARPWFAIPVLSWHAGAVTGCYQRRYLEATVRFPDAPRLTDRQRAALDRFDAALDDPGLHLAMTLAPGDVQLVHNHQILHDRTAFVDDPDPARRRHLLRLWLCPPTGRPLPPHFAERYRSVTIGDRGGVVPADASVVSFTP